ncbi:unnamed protein product, partial [marine sediment metagenome]
TKKQYSDREEKMSNYSQILEIDESHPETYKNNTKKSVIKSSVIQEFLILPC